MNKNVKVVESLGESIGAIWKKQQTVTAQNKLFYVASPLSSTPIPLYQWLIQHAREIPYWENMRFILMDELVEGNEKPFIYISQEDQASYERFAYTHFLNPLTREVKLADNMILKPELNDLQAYDKFISQHGGIDLLILALGVRGNYANVMPNTPENTGWHIAKLLDEFKKAHTNKDSQSYAGAYFRNYGMSLGHKQVLEAKKIVVMISGKNKRELTKQLLSYDNFNSDFPISIIYHPKVKDRVEIFITSEVLDKS